VLFAKYCYSNLIKEGEMGGAYSAHREIRNGYKITAHKHETGRCSVTPIYSWKDNIKHNLKETEYQEVDCGLFYTR
jgi:hypothetical protein